MSTKVTDILNPRSAGLAVNWYPFNQAFPGNGRIGDVDGIIERNGHTLIIEVKTRGVRIPKGQKIMYESLRKQKNSVIILWYEPSQEELNWIDLDKVTYAEFTMFGGEWRHLTKGLTTEGLCTILRRWWRKAEEESWTKMMGVEPSESN